MRIRLLQDVLEGGQVKTTIRSTRRQVIGWFAGTEIEVSEASGQKLIDAGTAEIVTTEEVAS